MLCLCTQMQAQEHQMTTEQAKSYYKSVSKKVTSCHDPSVVYEPSSKRYYIFGSHLAQAYTTDLQNWTNFRAPWGAVQADGTIKTSNVTNAEAFPRNQVSTITKGGKELAFGPFDANGWGAAYGGDYSINGNLWAPDVIYNEKMKKWCMYMSVNGPTYNSVIVLLTSDKIDGTYVYQGPVVFGGFLSGSNADISWKKTDLELVIGEQTSLPARYNQGASNWPKYWTNVIDPCVFYDNDGQLWMSYGSWFGGIWMLQLDEETGLRDYDVTYESNYSEKGQGVTSDPYFGKKIAGGYQVSGEASYIERIGNYYYLFMSYGGLDAKGGYQMRVFRSVKPDGPYKDGLGRAAIYTAWAMNYGANPDKRGEKILGAYDKWGLMAKGELAQGHNSIIAAPDGRTYLVYHTRFNDGSEGHLVRVHQVFVNEDGWLCAAPFEYNGEQTTDADIAAGAAFSDAEIAGDYRLLVHKYEIDHANLETVTPVDVTLTADGKVTGAYTGTWTTTPGTGYITLTLGTTTYKGVVIDEQMDVKSYHAVAITACAKTGLCVWAYKLAPDHALAMHINEQTVPVKSNSYVSENIRLMDMQLDIPGVNLSWNSSQPQVISNVGQYNPTGLAENMNVELTARLVSGNWYWTASYNVIAEKESFPSADWKTGMGCLYTFDDDNLTNELNVAEKAVLAKKGNNSLPTFATDDMRTGRIINTLFGANGSESYVAMPNPLYGATLTDGATLSFWARRADNNLWDALVAFFNPDNSSRLYLTGNLYLGYNNNGDTWLDVNHPSTTNPTVLTVGDWHLITLTFSRKSTVGVKFYVDGVEYRANTYAGAVGEKSVAAKSEFDYNTIVDHLTKCKEFYLGYGSFWGSAKASYDDVVVYDRPLSLLEVLALKTMENRNCNLAQVVTGIEELPLVPSSSRRQGCYDLSGRRLLNGQPKAPGLYIKDGRLIINR